MNRLILSITFLIYLSFGLLYSQNCDIDTLKYLKAYKYISEDEQYRKFNPLQVFPGKKSEIINVSTDIYDLDRFGFSSELNEFPKEKQLLNQYREKKKFIWENSFYSSCLDNLFYDKHKYENYIIFFSQIENNLLIANILPTKKNKYKINDYNEIASFTEGYLYLFIFEIDSSIKKVVRRKMIFD